VRKSAVTVVHDDHHELKNDLADLMTHKLTTAEKHYALSKKEKSAARASAQLQKKL